MKLKQIQTFLKDSRSFQISYMLDDGWLSIRLSLHFACLLCFIFIVFYQPVIDELRIFYDEHQSIRKSPSTYRHRLFTSTCTFETDRRGYHQKVISYSLDGDFLRHHVADTSLKPLQDTITHIGRIYPCK